MSKQSIVYQHPITREHKDEPTLPVLFLSSEGIGWEGVAAYAFNEPIELEELYAPGLSDISLVLFTRGSMYMGYRALHAPWNEVQVHQGDLILWPGEQEPHEVRWKGLSSEPMQTLRLQLDKNLFTRTAQEATGCDPARLRLDYHIGFQDPLLTQIGFALRHELEQRTPGGKLYAQTSAQLLAVHLLRHYSTVGDAIQEIAQGLSRRQMKRVKDFIEAHLSQDLSLDALAQQAGFSAYHFARLFRQTTGESPHQFVLRQRIERAQRLLKDTDAPLVNIALESGFANQSHLTQAFKRQFGFTPRAYRLNS